MIQSSVIQVRIDTKLKEDAESLFSDLGLDIPSAVRLFLKQSIARNGIPFSVKRAKSEKEKWEDDFYNPYNVAYLKQVLAEMKDGKNLEHHELIEVYDDA
ncbi:DNA-damage-inducible protein J [Spirochaetia bacterium]|nr:DNA-damage-inducible protein J [Spirochaetia bacterium]